MNNIYKSDVEVQANDEENLLDSTEVYDEADLASILETNFIKHARQKHQKSLAPEQHPNFDGETCVDCGDDIPQERLKMGRVRCVSCQTKLERINKLYGK